MSKRRGRGLADNTQWRSFVVLLIAAACEQRDDSLRTTPAVSALAASTPTASTAATAEPAVRAIPPTRRSGTGAAHTDAGLADVSERMPTTASRRTVKVLDCTSEKDAYDRLGSAGQLATVDGTLDEATTGLSASAGLKRDQCRFIHHGEPDVDAKCGRQPPTWGLKEVPSICLEIPTGSKVQPRKGLKVKLTVVIPDCAQDVFVGCRTVSVTSLIESPASPR